MIGTKFWGGLVGWVRDRLLQDGLISPEDMDLFQVVDEPEQALKIVQDFYAGPDQLKGSKGFDVAPAE